ncbi:hypothetical protein PSN_3027 [Pseudomonas sp. NGC7]
MAAEKHVGDLPQRLPGLAYAKGHRSGSGLDRHASDVNWLAYPFMCSVSPVSALPH